jgi:hypothetical protein
MKRIEIKRIYIYRCAYSSHTQTDGACLKYEIIKKTEYVYSSYAIDIRIRTVYLYTLQILHNCVWNVLKTYIYIPLCILFTYANRRRLLKILNHKENRIRIQFVCNRYTYTFSINLIVYVTNTSWPCIKRIENVCIHRFAYFLHTQTDGAFLKY